MAYKTSRNQMQSSNSPALDWAFRALLTACTESENILAVSRCYRKPTKRRIAIAVRDTGSQSDAASGQLPHEAQTCMHISLPGTGAHRFGVSTAITDTVWKLQEQQ